MQVILDSSFARLGSARIWGGKKGEFRDWTSGDQILNISDFIVFQSSHVLQIRLGFIANRKHKSTWCQVYINTKPNQAKFCELIVHVNTGKITDFDLNHQIQ